MKKGAAGNKYRTYDKDFKQSAVKIALEGKRSEAAIAKDYSKLKQECAAQYYDKRIII